MMARSRFYLDHNATTPLRAEARSAMLAAMEVVGNPSSVHAEGRATKAIVERARAQVAQLVGCEPHDIVFTSGATEAAALWFAGKVPQAGAGVEHDAVWGHLTTSVDVDLHGQVRAWKGKRLDTLQSANSETGVIQASLTKRPVGMSAITQQLGKLPFDFATSSCDAVLCSAHKFGGPKGVGAIILNKGIELAPGSVGGRQEMGRRAGTENVIGIAGFGAAAEAAQQDIEAGSWAQVEKLRNILEKALEHHASETIFIGKGVARLPNTACFAARGWKGETQVMAMDLAGFAISAGSACSSGKVKESRVLRAMGFDEETARCAIRVSLGLETTEEDVMRFAETWAQKWQKHQARAA